MTSAKLICFLNQTEWYPANPERKWHLESGTLSVHRQRDFMVLSFETIRWTDICYTEAGEDTKCLTMLDSASHSSVGPPGWALLRYNGHNGQITTLILFRKAVHPHTSPCPHIFMSPYLHVRMFPWQHREDDICCSCVHHKHSELVKVTEILVGLFPDVLTWNATKTWNLDGSWCAHSRHAQEMAGACELIGFRSIVYFKMKSFSEGSGWMHQDWYQMLWKSPRVKYSEPDLKCFTSAEMNPDVWVFNFPGSGWLRMSTILK